MPGQRFDGHHQIEVNHSGKWSPVLSGVSKPIAENIVKESINRVILG